MRFKVSLHNYNTGGGGVAGVSPVSPCVRGRGRGRGRLRDQISPEGSLSRSSSGSCLSMSPDREECEEQPQSPDTGLDCGQAENVSASLDQLHLGIEGAQQQQNPSRFFKEEQFPKCGSVDANHDFLPPQSRLSGLFPGTTGRPCKLQTNHFPISLKFPEDVIFMYDVCIVPPWSREYKRTDKQLYHDTIALWKKSLPNSNMYSWVFDGHKQLFCTKSHRVEDLPDLKVSVWFAEEERYVDMMVKDVIQVSTIPVSKDLKNWAIKGRSGQVPQDALQALDIILKQAVSLDTNFHNIGRQYFPMDGQTLDVGFGKEIWCGTFSQVRPYGWKDHEILITLNVDTSHKPAVKNLYLTKESAKGKSDSYIQQVVTMQVGT